MDKNFKSNVVAVVLALAAVTGGFYMVNNYTNPFAASGKEKVSPGPDLSKQFEDFLNGFLKDVNSMMSDYKQARNILTQAVDPINLTQPEYVEENYKTVQDLLPALQAKMSDVLQRFDIAEAKVSELLAGQPEDARQIILGKWNELRSQQGRLYEAYFASESDILSAYRDLMDFYYSRRETLKADIDTQTITFAVAEDEAEAQRFRERIEELKRQQDELMKSQRQE